MEYNKVLSQVIILFLIMLVGFFARRKNIINKEVNKGLTDLVLNITFPFMVIASFNFKYSSEMLITGVKILIFSISIHFLMLVVGGIIFKKYPENMKGVLRFVIIFSNCGFMGYPIIDSVYGKTGVFYASIYNIVFNVFMWTFGVMLFTGKRDTKSIKRLILNPGIFSVIIGLILFAFSIKLPDIIYNTLNMVGSTTTPLSMIVIGSMLADSDMKNIFTGFTVYYASAIRLILTPAAVFIVLKLLGVNGMLLGIPVLISGMPAAANTAIMAEKFEADSLFASKCVFISSLFSIITIPLLLYFL